MHCTMKKLLMEGKAEMVSGSWICFKELFDFVPRGYHLFIYSRETQCLGGGGAGVGND